jgi:hypothetical protein
MPYITQERRTALDTATHEVATNAGELNYLFTVRALDARTNSRSISIGGSTIESLAHDLRTEIDDYIESMGLRYQYVNDVIGALTGAKLEMQRRLGIHTFDDLFDGVRNKFYNEVAAPYENLKIEENGDVYPALT